MALARSTSVRAGLAHRARIVLLAAEGLANTEIARWTGATRPTVINWRNRYAAGGINALSDMPRSGRPAVVDELEVVATTLADGGRPPAHLGASHWSARLLGSQLGISHATVARIWRKWGIHPQQVETFTLAADPTLDAQVRGVAGSPTDGAVAQQRPVPDRSAAGPQPTDPPDPWLNLVEVSLSIITHQAIRRGTYSAVRNLLEALGALTDSWQDRHEPARQTGASPVLVAAGSARGPQIDRQATSDTPQRSSPVESDARPGPDRPGVRRRDRKSRYWMSLRTDFHGSRSRWSGPTTTEAGG
ncbi:MAG TPA: helix-turn-helix domain-containing protein [Pseudonocardiaceae bacterium]